MANKCRREEEEEDEDLRTIEEALRESCEEQLAAEPDLEEDGGVLAFYKTKDGKTVCIRSSEGGFGSISAVEFDEVRKNIDMPCLICGRSLALAFEHKRNPVLYLECSVCEAPHRVLNDVLYLSD